MPRVALRLNILSVAIALAFAGGAAQQWERAVVLRLGRFVGLRGPGLFGLVHDVERAALEVQDYEQAVSWAAPTAG